MGRVVSESGRGIQVAGKGIQVAGEGIQGDFEGIRTSVRVFRVWASQQNACFTNPKASESGLEFLNYNIITIENRGVEHRTLRDIISRMLQWLGFRILHSHLRYCDRRSKYAYCFLC